MTSAMPFSSGHPSVAPGGQQAHQHGHQHHSPPAAHQHSPPGQPSHPHGGFAPSAQGPSPQAAGGFGTQPAGFNPGMQPGGGFGTSAPPSTARMGTSRTPTQAGAAARPTPRRSGSASASSTGFGSILGSVFGSSSKGNTTARASAARDLRQQGPPDMVIPMIRDLNCLTTLQTLDVGRILRDHVTGLVRGRRVCFEDAHTQETAWTMAPVRPTPFIFYVIDSMQGIDKDAYFDCIRSLAPTSALMLLILYPESRPPSQALMQLPSGFFTANGQYTPRIILLSYQRMREKKTAVCKLVVDASPTNHRHFTQLARTLEESDMPIRKDPEASGLTTFRMVGAGSDQRAPHPMSMYNGGGVRMGGVAHMMPHVVIEADAQSPEGGPGSGHGSGSGYGQQQQQQQPAMGSGHGAPAAQPHHHGHHGHPGGSSPQQQPGDYAPAAAGGAP
eukprot:TRINITY_DN15181_c0_g1_i1.p1 TRINITY_DN15181_c0_g1~~TRINITY_DN15181_c0_g1_i1.p1  ORF type:complete len:445 (-),score=80.56 TRINITY_DN15181_c0_g1_i1:257-1591(-)